MFTGGLGELNCLDPGEDLQLHKALVTCSGDAAYPPKFEFPAMQNGILVE